ncbi:MAG: Holliday junction resolvase-like protein [Candidatus Diapherotrites archaeon]|nr:Holliday junction resolvase-like protein [Candidatus Diapherotrites archaeon]
MTEFGIFFIAIILLGFATLLGIFIGKKFAKKETENNLQFEREDAVKRSRAVLSGQFSEQIAPYFPNFPYSPTEVKFLGKPVDFIVFKGMDQKQIEEIVFLEIKTGQSQLNAQEKSLKESVQKGKVSWKEYRIEHKDQ